MMEDFSPSDIALDYGYYQEHSEVLPLVMLAVGLLGFVSWVLRGRQ